MAGLHRYSLAPMLRDQDLDERLTVDGYIVTPFFDADEVAILRDAYREFIRPEDHGLTVEYMRADRSAMAAIAELVGPLWDRHLGEVFVDHRVAMTTFVTKHPGPESPMFLHDDRTFVDPRKFRSASIWIPLHDINPDLPNGGLHVVPKSHRLNNSWSGHGRADLISEHAERLAPYRVPLTVPAGSAAIYDSRLLHGSPANEGPGLRIALVGAVLPNEATAVQVIHTSPTVAEVFEVPDSFFIDVHPGDTAITLRATSDPVDVVILEDRLDWPDVEAALGEPPASPTPIPGVGLAILSYEAEATIAAVLARVPIKLEGARLETFVVDDASRDATAQRASAASCDVDVIRHHVNLGNGANQKWCIREAAARGLEVVVVAHGDDQHPVELIDHLIAPILRGEADVVMGSRVLERGAARRGRMPLVRLAGNWGLSRVLNAIHGANYSEWFSGFRAYRLTAIDGIDLDDLPNGFDFDPAVLAALHASGSRITEVPIPTRYGDEISRVNLVTDGLRILMGALRRRFSR